MANIHVPYLQRSSLAYFNKNSSYKLYLNTFEKTYYRCIYKPNFIKNLCSGLREDGNEFTEDH